MEHSDSDQKKSFEGDLGVSATVIAAISFGGKLHDGLPDPLRSDQMVYDAHNGDDIESLVPLRGATGRAPRASIHPAPQRMQT